MKKIFLLLAIACLVSCKGNETTKADENSVVSTESPTSEIENSENKTETVTDPIVSIRTKVERINTQSLTKKSFEFMCDEKMMVDYFYDGDEIVKIAIDFGTVGDTYAKEGYYYDDGNLIFVYEFVEGGPACEGCIETHEYRTYVENNAVLKHLKDKNETECRKCNFSKKSRHYKLLSAKTEQEVKALLCR